MAYLEKRLGGGEHIVHRGRFHWLGYAQAWLALLVLGIFLVGIYIFARMMLIRLTTEMVVTNQRVVLKRGWLSVDVDSLTLEAVESIKMKESLLGRILGYGRVMVSGKGELHIDYPSMANPGDFSQALESARSGAVAAVGTGAPPEPFDDPETS